MWRLDAPPISVFNWSCGLFLAILFTMGVLGLLYDLIVDPIRVLQRLTQVGAGGLWDYTLRLIWHALIVGWGVFWTWAVILALAARIQGRPPVLTRREWVISGGVLMVAVGLLIGALARR
jgi:hypothetical protein